MDLPPGSGNHSRRHALDAFGRRTLPSWAEVDTVEVPPRGELPFVEADWNGALIVVDGGRIDLHCHRGGTRSFPSGSMLWLTGLSLRTIANPGDAPVTLVAIRRRHGTRRR